MEKSECESAKIESLEKFETLLEDTYEVLLEDNTKICHSQILAEIKL